MKSVAKHLLLSLEKPPTIERLKKEIPDGTEKEVNTLDMLIRILKPYIPVKKDRFAIGCQLPFCLLANDVLCTVGYARFDRLLFPKPKPTQLQALDVSAPSLYQMLTSGPNPLSIADFNSNKIDSVEYARSNKDAVFCSIFDMAQINQACKSYKLTFAQNIKVLPGMKACKVLGSKTVYRANEVQAEKPDTYFSRILNHPVIIEECKNDSSELTKEITALQDKVKKLNDTLRDLYKSDKVVKLTSEIKQIKTDMIRAKNDSELKAKLKIAKDQKYKAYLEIQKCKSAKASPNQDLYYKRMALRYKAQISKKRKDVSDVPKEEEAEDQPSILLTSATRGVFKAEQCSLLNPEKGFIFSGTDNGIIKMSTTTVFDLNRYKFYLNLYNRYQVLQEAEVNVENGCEYLNLPKKTLVINSADIDAGCSHRKVRKKLERAKRITEEGKEVAKIEKKLSESPVTTKNNTLSQYKNLFDLYNLHSEQLQLFYSSKKRSNILRSKEIQEKRFLDSLVDSERRSIVSGKGRIQRTHKTCLLCIFGSST